MRKLFIMAIIAFAIHLGIEFHNFASDARALVRAQAIHGDAR